MSYTSSAEIIEREATAMLEEQRSSPEFWNAFWRRRVRFLIAHLVVIVVAWVAWPFWEVVTIVAAVAVVSFLGWTVIDSRAYVRNLWDSYRQICETGCPPGTVVEASWSHDAFEFVLPWATHVVHPSTISAGRQRDGVVVLDQEGRPFSWFVPNEMIGPGGLGVLREVLGDRFVAA